jgi:protein-S-isoprenylcysteine O-methyltransferase Ste14
VGLVALGTGAFFLESLLYLLLGVLNRELSQLPMLGLPFMESDPFEFAGALIMTLGYAIFIWSVIVRGRYATSWTMPPEQQLVDWGPYRYVRHPSYLGYFLMFIGFFLMWSNVLSGRPFISKGWRYVRHTKKQCRIGPV